MLKRLSIVLLAIAFVLGTTAQVVPRAFASSMAETHHAGMSRHGAMPMSGMGAPCKGMTPACIDEMGCVIVIALPASPAAVLVPVLWAAVVYLHPAATFDGRVVEPELFPPILSA